MLYAGKHNTLQYKTYEGYRPNYNGACIVPPLIITQMNGLVCIVLYTVNKTTTQRIFFYYVFINIGFNSTQ